MLQSIDLSSYYKLCGLQPTLGFTFNASKYTKQVESGLVGEFLTSEKS